MTDIFDYFKRALPLEIEMFVLSSRPTNMKDAADKAQTYVDIGNNEKESFFSTKFSSITLTDEPKEHESSRKKKLLCIYHNYHWLE